MEIGNSELHVIAELLKYRVFICSCFRYGLKKMFLMLLVTHSITYVNELEDST